MKLLRLGMAGICTILAGSPAFAGWQGTLVVLKASGSECDGVASVGSTFISRYAPKLTASDPASRLLFTSQVSTGMLVPAVSTSIFGGKGSHTDTELTMDGGLSSASGSHNFKLTPSTVKSTTKFVLLEGTITKFRGYGCTVTVRAGYSLIP